MSDPLRQARTMTTEHAGCAYLASVTAPHRSPDRFLFQAVHSITVGCMPSADPAPPTAPDRYLRRAFGDDEPTRLGTGWVAGVGSLLGGALAFFAVLCFHFPQLLTAPVL